MSGNEFLGLFSLLLQTDGTVQLSIDNEDVHNLVKKCLNNASVSNCQ
jgi:hypothetical protein